MNSQTLSSTVGSVAVICFSSLTPVHVVEAVAPKTPRSIEGSRSVVVRPFGIDTTVGTVLVDIGSQAYDEELFIEDVMSFYADLASRQTHLGEDFITPTDDDLWDLYI